MAGERESRLVREGAVRAWVAPGVVLADVIVPDGDADALLTRPDCRIVKLQRKVAVGRVETGAGVLWVKRYNVFAARVALASLVRPSPAFGAWSGAAALRARGFATPDVVAAIEERRGGVLRKSFFVTREVADARTADLRWADILADAAPARRRARRALARALGRLFGRLHARGVYHNDLKDVNVLVRGPADDPELVLLDLERVRVFRRVGRGRRRKNVVQLDRTLGRRASRTDRLRFLHAYLGHAEPGDADVGTTGSGTTDFGTAASGTGTTRATCRVWVAAVQAATAAKERERRRTPVPSGPRVACTVVCRDEAAQIAACLETVAWCDEIVVVDSGSTDDTVAIARRFTDRVLQHDWAGYGAQKRWALEQARADWVLNLDADERVPPELATEIRRALAAVPPDVDGFAIPRLVAYLGRWWYRGGWYPRRVLRLVRRERAHWGGTEPHDRAEVEGHVARLRQPLLHHTYDDVADHLRTVGRLTEIAAANVGERRAAAGRMVIEPAWRFARAYVLKRGWREGVPGFFVAATDAFYVFLRWARVWEARRAIGGAADPRATAEPMERR